MMIWRGSSILYLFNYHYSLITVEFHDCQLGMKFFGERDKVESWKADSKGLVHVIAWVLQGFELRRKIKKLSLTTTHYENE